MRYGLLCDENGVFTLQSGIQEGCGSSCHIGPCRDRASSWLKPSQFHSVIEPQLSPDHWWYLQCFATAACRVIPVWAWDWKDRKQWSECTSLGIRVQIIKSYWDRMHRTRMTRTGIPIQVNETTMGVAGRKSISLCVFLCVYSHNSSTIDYIIHIVPFHFVRAAPTLSSSSTMHTMLSCSWIMKFISRSNWPPTN